MSTEDRLHEPYRLPLMKETLDLHASLREKGIASALAGAGPSLICLVDADAVDETASFAENILPEGWTVMTPGWDSDGAQVR
jgi:homoserine kinase